MGFFIFRSNKRTKNCVTTKITKTFLNLPSTSHEHYVEQLFSSYVVNKRTINKKTSHRDRLGNNSDITHKTLTQKMRRLLKVSILTSLHLSLALHKS